MLIMYMYDQPRNKLLKYKDSHVLYKKKLFNKNSIVHSGWHHQETNVSYFVEIGWAVELGVDKETYERYTHNPLGVTVVS